MRKNRREKVASILRKCRSLVNNIRKRAEDFKFDRLITGPLAPPQVFCSRSQLYVAYRPDSDFGFFAHPAVHPELQSLANKWVANNVKNNAGDLPRFYALALNIKQVIADGIAGDFAELGVYRGNSAAILAHYARDNHRSLFLFDTFEGFEAKDLTGIDANKEPEFADTSLDMVRQNVGEGAVIYVKGYFPETITRDISERQFAVVHLDCDLYDPMKAGLEFFYPRLTPGGLLIIHDYSGIWWDGAKRAVDEYLREIKENVILLPDKSGTAMFRKTR